jgi:hypothetical protein
VVAVLVAVAVVAAASVVAAAVAPEAEAEAEAAVDPAQSLGAQLPLAAAGMGTGNKSRRAGKADTVGRAHSPDRAGMAGMEEMADWKTTTSG